MESNKKPADAEIADLLADLDAEFGKKPKGKALPPAPHKALNKAWHEQNPRLGQGPRGQLERMKFENYYDWEMHKQMLKDGLLEHAQEAGVPELQWLPEAQISYIINQRCGCCAGTTQFVGNEYIRFRGRRRKYRTLEGVERETYPTMIKRLAEVDANLVAFGLPGGDPLPDLVEELEETVRRCVACLQLEKQAFDMFIKATQPDPQEPLDLQIDIPLTDDGR